MNRLNEDTKGSGYLVELIESFPDAVAICRGSGEIIVHNRAFTDLMGLSPDEVCGKMLQDFTVIPKGIYKCSTGGDIVIDDDLNTDFHLFVTNGSHTNRESYIINKDNIAVPVIFSLSYLLDVEGSPEKALVIIKDAALLKKAEIEQRHARQTAEEANRAKSEFLANMSHEIRTPMNGVLGMLSLLKKSEIDNKQKRWVEVAQIAAESLLLIVNDILDFSKIEAGSFRLDEKPFDLWLMIKDIADLYRIKAYEKNLSFSYRVDDKVPVMVIGDPARLRQILTNLIGNAIKFTVAGSVSIYVKNEEDSDTETKLKVTVTDTGTGIPENMQSLLFKRFSAFPDSPVAKAYSTGLGLVISKQLCELMGGGIGFRSTQGKGSSFWFICVVKKQDSSGLKDFSSPEILKDKRILLVENIEEPECAMFMLQKHGCCCEFAPDGGTAVSMLQRGVCDGEPFHVVILDRQMHDMDSFRFAEIVKGSPALSDTHILMVSSSGIRGDAAHLQKCGFSGYITGLLTDKSLPHCLISLFKESGFVTRHTAAEKAKQNTVVLIVEDNDINMEVASGIVESLGYNFETATDGIKAVETFKKKTYDIVLMDIRMPVLDGYGATRQIRSYEKEKGWSRVPVIAMSADVTEEAMLACFDAGMDGFIAKPISSKCISEILEKYPFNVYEDDRKVFLAHDKEEILEPGFFDMQEVLERFNNNEGLLKKIVKGFIENFPVELEKLKRTVQERNQDDLRLQAHSLKGSFGNIGAKPLRKIALELEKAGKESAFKRAEKLLPELSNEFERFREFAVKEVL